MCVYVCVCAFVCVCLCVSMCKPVYLFVYVCVCVCVHLHPLHLLDLCGREPRCVLHRTLHRGFNMNTHSSHYPELDAVVVVPVTRLSVQLLVDQYHTGGPAGTGSGPCPQSSLRTRTPGWSLSSELSEDQDSCLRTRTLTPH